MLTYALAHPKDGYRLLTWQMVAAAAAPNPPSAYRILDDADRCTKPVACDEPTKSTGPHERWHTDLIYVRIGHLVLPGDGTGCLQPVHHAPGALTTLRAARVQLVIQQALERTGATPTS